MLTWASLSAYGFDLAPFFLCAFSFAGVALCGVPLPSSFLQPDATPHHGGDGPAVVVERTESQILVWYLLLAPCVLHVALHYSDSDTPLVFRFEARGRSRGVDIGYVSL